MEACNFVRLGAQNAGKSAHCLHQISIMNIDWRHWGHSGCDKDVRLVGYGGVVDRLQLGSLIL